MRGAGEGDAKGQEVDDVYYALRWASRQLF